MPHHDKRPPSRAGSLAAAALAGAAAGVLVSRNFLESEKRIGKEVRPDYSVGDPAFERSMSQLLGPPLLPGNRVETLRNGCRFYPAMLEAIASAKTSVTFENFVFREGEVATRFTDALLERANAGVPVHFLQDAFGCDELRGPSMRRLRNSPVELEIFRFFKLSKLNKRTHRKLLIIDGKVGFTGGAGVCDHWDGDADAPGKWRDTHYRVEGPAVAQMQQAFMENWMQTRAEILHGDRYFPALAPAGPLPCQVFMSSGNEGADSARVMILLALAAARKSIRIANAYFLPDDLIRQTLVEACERGVTTELVTAGPVTDQPLTRLVGRERWKPLLEAGARHYEFRDRLFHCKYLIVDDLWVSVGSANFDNRSLRINDEANLNVLDAEFAAEQIRMFEDDKVRSRPVPLEEWRRRPWRERIPGGAAQILRPQL